MGSEVTQSWGQTSDMSHPNHRIGSKLLCSSEPLFLVCKSSCIYHLFYKVVAKI